MLGGHHAVVWIDHDEARILDFDPDPASENEGRPVRRIPHKAERRLGAQARGRTDFYYDVADAIAHAKEILIAGPSRTKTDFAKYLAKHQPELLDRVVGIESLTPVTDRQLRAEAQRFFGSRNGPAQVRGARADKR